MPARVEADYDGAGLALHIDAVLLHDAVVSTAGPHVVIEAADPLGPVVIRSATPDSFSCVVMPLQVGRTRRR